MAGGIDAFFKALLPQQKSRETVRDIVAGTISGIAGKLIEYPFDTLKVRMQTAFNCAFVGGATTLDTEALTKLPRPPHPPTPLAALPGAPPITLRSIVAKEGLMGLYRGMSLPLAGTVLETATLFTANGWLRRELKTVGSLPAEAELPMRYVLLAGGGTGFFVSWVLTPIELVKCRMQVAGTPVDGTSGRLHPRFGGPLECLARALRDEGVSVLYRGHAGTLLREIPGTACWFGAYEMFIRAMTPPGSKRGDLNPVFPMIAGALGGMSYWAVMYPADTAKSAMQTVGSSEALPAAAAAPPGPPAPASATAAAGGAAGFRGGVGAASGRLAFSVAPPAVRAFSSGSGGGGGGGGGVPGARVAPPSFTATLLAIYRAGGLRALYAGMTPTIIRAAPSNAAIFVTYEWAAKHLSPPLGLEE